MKVDPRWILAKGKPSQQKSWLDHDSWKKANMPQFITTLEETRTKRKKKNKGVKRKLWMDHVKSLERLAS